MLGHASGYPGYIYLVPPFTTHSYCYGQGSGCQLLTLFTAVLPAAVHQFITQVVPGTGDSSVSSVRDLPVTKLISIFYIYTTRPYRYDNNHPGIATVDPGVPGHY